MSEYQPGIYVKGDDERVAKSASTAVALVFDGFKLKEAAEAPSEPVKVDEQPKTETPATPAVPSPSALARPRQSQEDDKS